VSTDFQRAREALGARLRELRTEARLTGRQLAETLGWPPSKVSKLETGRQTATETDLQEWAAGTGSADLAAGLIADLRGMETQYQSWQRRLASGHRRTQQEAMAEEAAAGSIRAYEPTVVPGTLQTPDYARHVIASGAALHQSPKDVEDAVRERMRRQELLYERGRQFHFILWEGALRAMVCPRAAMAFQLDRLAGLVGLDTVRLGIIPFTAALPLSLRHGFWIHDEAYVTVETINAGMWLDDAADVALYVRAWSTYEMVAVYGDDAHRLIGQARHALGPI